MNSQRAHNHTCILGNNLLSFTKKTKLLSSPQACNNVSALNKIIIMIQKSIKMLLKINKIKKKTQAQKIFTFENDSLEQPLAAYAVCMFVCLLDSSYFSPSRRATRVSYSPSQPLGALKIHPLSHTPFPHQTRTATRLSKSTAMTEEGANIALHSTEL